MDSVKSTPAKTRLDFHLITPCVFHEYLIACYLTYLNEMMIIYEKKLDTFTSTNTYAATGLPPTLN